MDLKNWASTLASRGQKLAREGMEYVNQKIEKQNIPHSVSSLFQAGSTSRADLNSCSGDSPSSLVYYAIQNELSPPPFSSGLREAAVPRDADASFSPSSHFNAFLLPDGLPADAVTFSLFTSLFPVPGQFCFRFKVPSNASPEGYVWRHISKDEEDDFVPCFQGAIVCRALQIPAGVDAAPRAPFAVHVCSPSRSSFASNRAAHPPASGTRSGSARDDASPSEPRSQTSPSQPAASAALSSPRRIDTGHGGQGSRDFADLWSGDSGGKRSDGEHPSLDQPHTPFASGVATAGRPACQGTARLHKVEMPNRDDLVADRISRTESRIQEKLQEAQERRQQELSKMQERLTIPDEVQLQLEKWAKSSDGKYKDIRTLLCTVHEVLWPGADWQPVSISTLMISSQVKKHYRKALLLTHPDKHQSSSAEQLFRAEKIFQAFNEAFKVHPV
ncbi:LOC100145185 protein, related [Neospora caninum Liverpool]|uniref:LOC100145185 protein, related n=1 Tax=Neospora caninum (strain Liverpool) TaxID=572307 RepID=F0VGH6_NEOCL|nr:LOC100145185 protein, related [Neospora caninum Liverpool]CBZ52820.1 LOC100145185 protein, related [Neospora caninum Liverpool]CEL66800.1 TPA: LOC100145185 protein, related [Neospora caninum Liverpool]|eukprot:XP_003882852.1 LOC100145185 protein, related [Neospora caninum Liverpool]